MYERLKFEVHVERATPACSENCENLRIDDNRDLLWINGIKSVSNSFRCVNDAYCSNLWRCLKKATDQD